jgi:DNA replication protein DnaC
MEKIKNLQDEVKAVLAIANKRNEISKRVNYVPDYFLKQSDEWIDEFIKQCFLEYDSSITEANFVFLPEYKKLREYLKNTQGKGLLLSGGPGVGKSIILKKIIPTVYALRNLEVFPVSCYDLHKIINPKESNETVFDRVSQRRHILLDEIGVEINVNIYGEKFNPVEWLINASEDDNKALFATTNLNDEMIYAMYGKRAFDRLIKKVTKIEFVNRLKSSSLRG